MESLKENKNLAVVLLLVAAVFLGVSLAETGTLQERLAKKIDADKNASSKTKTFAKDVLLPQCTNSVFVKAVAEQNAEKVSLDEIKKIDQEWRDAEEELPIHKEKMSNACAKEVIRIIKSNPAIIEAFVMDNQGANVGQNALTSDYWQGDEAKWSNSYNNAKGGIEIGEVEFDKSANVQLQQISLPIINADTKVIGAVCWGVAVDKL